MVAQACDQQGVVGEGEGQFEGVGVAVLVEDLELVDRPVGLRRRVAGQIESLHPEFAAGGIIGNYMDRQAAEMERETLLQAVSV